MCELCIVDEEWMSEHTNRKRVTPYGEQNRCTMIMGKMAKYGETRRTRCNNAF